MRIIITGTDGFIGKNLRVRLRELGHSDIVAVTRTSHSEKQLNETLATADFVFHLAGVNRPQDPEEFFTGNVQSTEHLCHALKAAARPIPVVYTSSTQSSLDNAYGRSKRRAEEALLEHGRQTGSPIHIFRLTNVFGKWARPNYNSAVATFCHNLTRGLPITINNAASPLQLVYVDDVVTSFIKLLDGRRPETEFAEVSPVYDTTVGFVAQTLQDFADSRTSLMSPRVGTGLIRALYSTYVSHLPTASFAYDLPRHADPRGVFVEMLKTPDAGQFSYFTAFPGVTRGEHYHHSKTEKFLVIRGTAHFGFRHIDTGETHEIITRGPDARVVETVPGWTHNITNIGDDELIVMLWANEVFDRNHPDTIAMKVSP